MTQPIRAEDFGSRPSTADIVKLNAALARREAEGAFQPFAFARPGTDFCFDVRHTRFKDPQIFPVLFLTVMAVAPMVFLSWVPGYGHDLMPLRLFMAVLLCLLLIRIARNYFIQKKLELNPVLAEVFQNGIWFSKIEVFVPYDRIAQLSVYRMDIGTIAGGKGPRLFHWQIHAGRRQAKEMQKHGFDYSPMQSDEKISLRPRWLDGYVTPGFAETFENLAQIMTEACAATGRPAPLFYFEPPQPKPFYPVRDFLAKCGKARP